jgi:hypothetical protein
MFLLKELESTEEKQRTKLHNPIVNTVIQLRCGVLGVLSHQFQSNSAVVSIENTCSGELMETKLIGIISNPLSLLYFIPSLKHFPLLYANF